MKRLNKNKRTEGTVSSEEEEILPLTQFSSDEDAHQIDENTNELDIENENYSNDDNLNEDKNILSDFDDLKHSESDIESQYDWGTKKTTYYDHDFKDIDYLTNDADADLIAEMEQEEAQAIQKRLASIMDDAKSFQNRKEEYGSAKKQKLGHSILASDENSVKLKNLSEKHPDLLKSIYRLKNINEQVQKSVDDLKIYENDEKLDEYVKKKIVSLMQVKRSLLLCYRANLYFLISMIIHNEIITDHPVLHTFTEFDIILEDIQRFEYRLANELNAMAAIDVVSGAKNTDTTNDNVSLENEEDDKHNNELDSDMEDQSSIDQAEHIKISAGSKEKLVKDGKRRATKEIIVNKGLMRVSKKENKTPRIKNKIRYKRKVNKLRGKVRPVKSKEKAYGGEVSGIRKSVIHSVKFK